MKTFFKIFAVIFTILFTWSGYLQNNDPDALLWYTIYGVAALGSLLFVLGRLPHIAAALLCLAYLIGGFISWPETFEGFEIGAGDIVNIERGREACGLLIASAVFLVYALRIRYKKRF
ncbi:transmembrane 220 family protein [Pricia sp.]|uniref:transmembrane 220 family protein n=1 Tax=Pricia sp. TaxID=2268138 RepID=UPI003593AE1E